MHAVWRAERYRLGRRRARSDRGEQARHDIAHQAHERGHRISRQTEHGLAAAGYAEPQRLSRPLRHLVEDFFDADFTQRLRDMVKETIPNNKADRTALKQLAVGQPDADAGVTAASSPVPPPTTGATVSA